MKKFLLSLTLLSALFAVQAQTPTTTGPGSNCTVFRNFNQFNEDFTTPSIYGDDLDVSLFYNQTRGALVEASGITGPRNGSVISPAYLNSLDNEVTVGFYYEAPVGTEFRIRVVSALSNPPERIMATTANGPIFTPLPVAAGSTTAMGYVCVRIQDLDLDANEAYRFEVTYRYTGATGTGATPFLFDDISLTVIGGPLPVTFQGLVAREMSNGSTKLLWDVSNEVNVKGYDVETSVDGSNFTSIGFVPATGDKVYSFTYNDKISGTRFFRVKSIDLDHSIKLSSIVKVKGSAERNSTILLYPVPATNYVNVEHNKLTPNAMISIVSPEGRIVRTVRPKANTLLTYMTINDLKAGVYFVRYDDGEGNVQTIKLVKN